MVDSQLSSSLLFLSSIFGEASSIEGVEREEAGIRQRSRSGAKQNEEKQ